MASPTVALQDRFSLKKSIPSVFDRRDVRILIMALVAATDAESFLAMRELLRDEIRNTETRIGEEIPYAPMCPQEIHDLSEQAGRTLNESEAIEFRRRLLMQQSVEQRASEQRFVNHAPKGGILL
jgi:hypothetical protein